MGRLNTGLAGGAESFGGRTCHFDASFPLSAFPGPRLFQRLIIAGGELGEEVVLVEREMLDEGHGHNLLSWINLTISRGCAILAELSNGGRHGKLPRIGRHFHA